MFELAGPCSFYFLFLAFQVAAATQINHTIDDTYGDSLTGARPTYLPTTGGVWAGAACKGCAIQPNPNMAFDGSWTAATYHPGLDPISIQFQFTGTAIYVFFILPNTAAVGAITQTECYFTLDGQPAGNFFHAASPSLDYTYNALVFSRSDLKNAQHTLNISTSRLNHSVFLNFDYAIYTSDDTPPNSVIPFISGSSSSTNATNPSSGSFNSTNATNSRSGSMQISQTTAKSYAVTPLVSPSTAKSYTVTTLASPSTANSYAVTPLTSSSTATSTTSTSTSHSLSVSTSINSPTGSANTSSGESSGSSSTHNTSPTVLVAAVGSSLGAVAFLVVLSLVLCRRRRRRNVDNIGISPTVPTGYQDITAESMISSTNQSRAASEFFPEPLNVGCSSDQTNQSDRLDPNYNNPMGSRFAILARHENIPPAAGSSTPLRPLLLPSEASRRLRQHTGIGTIQRPPVSARTDRMRFQEPPQRPHRSYLEQSLVGPPPEYSHEQMPSYRH